VPLRYLHAATGVPGIRRVGIALVALAGIITASLVLGRASPVGDEQAARQTDTALVAGLEKGDHKRISALLDRRFTWIDSEGRSRSRRETLKDFSTFFTANRGASDRDAQTFLYGRLFMVRGSHDKSRFLRVFVKRQHGWKAIVLMETPAADEEHVASARPVGNGECENPCRTVPYQARTQTQKEVLAAWQQTKVLEWMPDAGRWAQSIADEFMIIRNGTVRDKDERIAEVRNQQEAGIGTPGDPVASMRIFSFGTCCALMFSRHAPYGGGKPYVNVAVWVLRESRWQLALTQHASIQAAPPSAAIARR
jgi:hypothetical protein